MALGFPAPSKQSPTKDLMAKDSSPISLEDYLALIDESLVKLLVASS